MNPPPQTEGEAQAAREAATAEIGAARSIPSLAEYEKAIKKALKNTSNGARTTCTCGHSLLTARLDGYQHDEGYPVLMGRRTVYWWLYLHCGICGYDWALWKLNIADKLPAGGGPMRKQTRRSKRRRKQSGKTDHKPKNRSPRTKPHRKHKHKKCKCGHGRKSHRHGGEGTCRAKQCMCRGYDRAEA